MTVLLLLLSYAATATALIGRIGFWGDDWWVFSYAYRWDWAHAVYYYARAERRPVEGAYWSTMYEIFGLERLVYTFSSLLIFALTCILVFIALQQSFPQRKGFASASALFAFFMPMLMETTYFIHMDNGRIQMLFLWASVIMFQWWLMRWRNWIGLLLPIGLYYLCTLAYESAAMLIFAIPLLLLPIEFRMKGIIVRDTLVKVIAAIGFGFSLFLFTRFVIFSGGAVKQTSTLPDPANVWKYLTTLIDFLVKPFGRIKADPAAILIAGLVTAGAAYVFLRTWRRTTPDHWINGAAYIALTGVAIFLLGIAPYTLIGPPPGSRAYSSAAYGVAMLIGILVMGWKKEQVVLITGTVGVIVLGFWAIYPLSIRHDWQEAAQLREQLMDSLLEQVPDVQPGTHFLLLDLQWDYGETQAPVITGETGLIHLFQRTYNDYTVTAHYLYYDNHSLLNEEGRLAIVREDTILARRGDWMPLDSLLIFRREGNRLVLLDSIAREDMFTGGVHTGIQWEDGQTVIYSNKARIIE